MRKLALMLLLFWPGMILAQCRGGSCSSGSQGPVGPGFYPQTIQVGPVQTSAPAYEWRTAPGEAGRLYLFRQGVQIGGMDLTEGYYRPYEAGQWGPPGKIDLDAMRAKIRAEIKAETPPAKQPIEQAVQQFPPDGVDRAKISTEEKYRCRDRENICKHDALAMIQEVPSMHLRRRLTVIGTPEQKRQILADAGGGTALAAWLAEQQCLLQDYDPADWAVRPETGFVHDGSPTIYWQDKPDVRGYGKVLLHEQSYGGPDALVATLRKKDPNYDPAKDPNGRPKKPDEPNSPDAQPAVGIDWSCCRPYALPGGILAALALLVARRKP